MTDTPSYEQAREELTQVVQRLEAGGSTLQESIELWERGEELAALCQRLLDGARTRFDAAVKAGAPTDEPPAAQPSRIAPDQPADKEAANDSS